MGGNVPTHRYARALTWARPSALIRSTRPRSTISGLRLEGKVTVSEGESDVIWCGTGIIFPAGSHDVVAVRGAPGPLLARLLALRTILLLVVRPEVSGVLGA